MNGVTWRRREENLINSEAKACQLRERKEQTVRQKERHTMQSDGQGQKELEVLIIRSCHSLTMAREELGGQREQGVKSIKSTVKE